jgi:hypothetical protein
VLKVWESITLVLVHAICFGVQRTVEAEQTLENAGMRASSECSIKKEGGIRGEKFHRITVESESGSGSDSDSEVRGTRATEFQGRSDTADAIEHEWRLSSALVSVGLSVEEFRALVATLDPTEADLETTDDEMPGDWATISGLNMMEFSQGID